MTGEKRGTLKRRKHNEQDDDGDEKTVRRKKTVQRKKTTTRDIPRVGGLSTRRSIYSWTANIFAIAILFAAVSFAIAASKKSEDETASSETSSSETSSSGPSSSEPSSSEPSSSEAVTETTSPSTAPVSLVGNGTGLTIATLAMVAGAMFMEVVCRASPGLGEGGGPEDSFVYQGVALAVRIISIGGLLVTSTFVLNSRFNSKQRIQAATFSAVLFSAFASLSILDLDWTAPLAPLQEAKRDNENVFVFVVRRSLGAAFKFAGVVSQNSGVGPPLFLAVGFVLVLLVASLVLPLATSVSPRVSLPLIGSTCFLFIGMLWSLGIIANWSGLLRGLIFCTSLTGVSACLYLVSSSLVDESEIDLLVTPFVVIGLIFLLCMVVLTFTVRSRVSPAVPNRIPGMNEIWGGQPYLRLPDIRRYEFAMVLRENQ